MDYNKFGTAANAQKTISTTAVSLADLLAGDSNWDKLKVCDRWLIRVQNEGILRMFYNGNTPTDALGDIISDGVIIQGANVNDIIMVKDATSTDDVDIFIAPAVMVFGFPS